MTNLTLNNQQVSYHFKDFARAQIRKLGVEGAVNYFRSQIKYYKQNKIYNDSWIHIRINEMCIDYIVNDLQL